MGTLNKILRTMGCWLVARSWDLSCTWSSCRLVSCTWSRPWSYHLEAYFLQSPLSSDSPDWWKIPIVEFEVGFSKRECKLPLQMRLGCPAVLFDSSKLKVRPWITVECLRIQAWHWHPSRHPLVSVFSMKRSEKILKDMKRWRSSSSSMVLCSVRLKFANPLHFFRIHSGLACNQFAWQRDSTQMLTWKLPIAAPCDDVLGSAVRCSWTTTSTTISVENAGACTAWKTIAPRRNVPDQSLEDRDLQEIKYDSFL